MAKPRVGLYARLSPRPDAQYVLGLDRQEKDGRKVAEVRGWEVAVVYRDEEASAYDARVTRDGFERMLADLAAGSIDGVVAYDLDRFVRQPSDLERAIRIYDGRPGLVFATVQGDLNLMSSDGRTMARVMVAFANKSSMDTSRRITRKHVELAGAGKPKGGPRGFGYEPDGITIREGEAKLIRDAARRVLAGESPWSIADGWRAGGILSPTGQPYRHKHLARVLRQPRIAGLRVYRGEVVGDATWPGILDRGTWEKVVATLDGRSQPGVTYARSYLLSGFLRCGKCAAHTVLAANPCRGRRTYFCMKDRGGCSGIRINADPTEDLMAAAVIGALTSPEMWAALDESAAEDVGRSNDDLTEVLACEEKLRQLNDDYDADRISRKTWLDAVQKVERRLEAAQGRLRTHQRTSTLAGLRGIDGDEMSKLWRDATLEQRRSLLAVVVDRVIVHPARSVGGHRLDDSRLEVIWRV